MSISSLAVNSRFFLPRLEIEVLAEPLPFAPLRDAADFFELVLCFFRVISSPELSRDRRSFALAYLSQSRQDLLD